MVVLWTKPILEAPCGLSKASLLCVDEGKSEKWDFGSIFLVSLSVSLPMEAQAQLQQEGEEYYLKEEAEEEEVGLQRRPSTTRKFGVDESDVPGNANVSTTSSSTGNKGTIAEEEPGAAQEWVDEVENSAEERGPETEAEQEPGQEVANAETIGSFEEQSPDEELEYKNDNKGEEQEAAPEPDEVDDDENNGGVNGKRHVAVHAPAVKTELDNDNGVEGKGSTWTNTVPLDDERGTKSIQTIVKTEYSNNKQVSYDLETVHENSVLATQRFSTSPSSQVDNQNTGVSGDEKLWDLDPSSPRKSSEEGNEYSKQSKIFEEIDLIEELNPEEADLDVEKVLEKQNTHDLYCPNCQSCITRRVILRRKKRKVRNVRYRAKDDKVEKTAASELYDQPVTVVKEDGSVDAITRIDDVSDPAVTDDIPRPEVNDREREAFKCLSCFSIFIPTGNGFKLFQLFGERKEVEKVHDPPEVPVAKSNSFFSFFVPRKEKPIIQQGNAVTKASRMDIEHRDSTVVMEKPSNQDAFVSPTKDTLETIEASSDMGLLNDKVSEPKEVEKETVSPLKDVPNNLKKKSSTIIEQYPGETLTASGQSPKDAYAKPHTIQVIPPSTPIASMVGQTLIEIDQKSVKDTAKELPAASAPEITDVLPSPVQPSLAESQKVADSAAKLRQRIKNIQQAINVGKELRDAVQKTTDAGDDVIVVIDRGITAAAAAEITQISDVVAQGEVPPQTGSLLLSEEPQVAEVHQPHEWDILKSIVYGGLIESITSLGVVSSAAGAGAATLNTLGLGLANLFGGLLVIANNLRELKNEQPSQDTAQVDRYQEVLGKRQHFPLHVTVAILSFIIFGCVAPITYAFSFRESDDRDYKLAAVAGASLFCIFLLAIGKAHVRKPPKTYFKTVLYYVILGVMASGVSFLVGELIDMLLTKLGWFDSTSTLSGTQPLGTVTMQSGWASY